MGSEVVVVKRNRRRAFALLWAVPAWLRGVALGARAILGSQQIAGLGSPDAASRLGAHSGPSDASFRVPTLARNDSGSHACTGCQLCNAHCPSRCLEVEGVSESAGGEGVTAFRLDVGRCIGCGECVAVCPESALQSVALESGRLALANGDSGLLRDLLVQEATL